jgi:hypothetical protein
MKNLSKYYLFLLAGLVAGFAAGAIVGHSIDGKAIGSPIININSSIPTNGQRNLLLIGVDRLDRNSPQLEGVWLVLLFPDNPRILLIPIFPSNSEFSTNQDDALVRSFRMTKDGNLSRTFLEELEKKNFWWTDILIADQTALSKTSRIILSSRSIELSKINASIFKSSIKWGQDSPRYTKKLFNKISSLCQGVNHTLLENNSSTILKLFPKHIRTNLELQEIINQIEQRTSIHGGLICEFPTSHP